MYVSVFCSRRFTESPSTQEILWFVVYFENVSVLHSEILRDSSTSYLGNITDVAQRVDHDEERLMSFLSSCRLLYCRDLSGGQFSSISDTRSGATAGGVSIGTHFGRTPPLTRFCLKYVREVDLRSRRIA